MLCAVCPPQLTPFEKNLEVWKQLWRVMERSHVVVQILDARNPLLFRSIDLEKYASEIDEGKTCLLVINKADYLTPLARRMWADYLTAQGIDFVFWSAALEQARLDDVDRARRRKEQLHNYHGHNVDRVDAGRIRGASSDEDESDVEEADRSDEDESKFLHQHAHSHAHLEHAGSPEHYPWVRSLDGAPDDEIQRGKRKSSGGGCHSGLRRKDPRAVC